MRSKKLGTAGTGSDTDGAFQVEMTMPVRQRRPESRSRAEAAVDSKPADGPQIPRIARLMALAIKFQQLVDRGEVSDYADLARLGYVTRARLTQIMNLCHLAPDIQERLLDSGDGRHSLSETTERDLREVSRIVCWVDQRKELSLIVTGAAIHERTLVSSRE